jgi:hypothetical protein
MLQSPRSLDNMPKTRAVRSRTHRWLIVRTDGGRMAAFTLHIGEGREVWLVFIFEQ